MGCGRATPTTTNPYSHDDHLTRDRAHGKAMSKLITVVIAAAEKA
jgi:hypothetical protein